MANGLQWMLRLPSGLRYQLLYFGPVIRATSHSGLLFNNSSVRSFARSTENLARQSKTVAPKTPKKQTPSKPGPPNVQNLAPRSPPVVRPQPGEKYADILGPESSTTLLYTAPKHGLFCFLSYLVGGTFLFGAYSYAQLYLKDNPNEKRKAWYVKISGGVTALFMAMFGTAIFLAPTKMIKSISMISVAATARANQAPYMLRLEIRRWLPFLKPDVLETTPSKISLDKNVPSGVSEIAFTNIPKMESRSFTEAYLSGRMEKVGRKGILGTFSGLNRSLLSAWPAMKREVGRMCLREHIAYVRVEGNGNFKLDLQGCSLLDMGRPLDRVTVLDSGSRLSIVEWVRSLMKG